MIEWFNCLPEAVQFVWKLMAIFFIAIYLAGPWIWLLNEKEYNTWKEAIRNMAQRPLWILLCAIPSFAITISILALFVGFFIFHSIRCIF